MSRGWRRAVMGVAAAATCAAVVAGCGGSAPDSGAPARKVIGVTLLTNTHAFYKALEAGLREEAAAKGLDLVVVACEMDPAKQASQIEDFVAQHVAAILAAPCDSDAIVPALSRAEAAGIPVFTADIAAHGGKIVSHVASDNVQGGRLAAEALASRIGGKGKVLIIDHPTVASVQDRVRGFEEGLKAYPGISIVARQSSDGQRAKATQIMEDMLQAHRDLAGVFGINDDSALGAAGVIEAAGRKDIVVIGYDATDEAQAAIRKGGPLKADVIQYPQMIGKTAIDLIAEHLAGQPVPAIKAIDVGIWDGTGK
jgi:ribose transport system substrate-binding protein